MPENDQEKDQEPVVVASAGRTVMAWMHYDATPGRSPFVHYTSSSDLLNWSTIQRIHPWEDGESGDPFLAVHPSVPANVYLVANARQFSDYRKPGGANKIVLVSSIDGGVSWTGPSAVCTTVVPELRHQKVLDKPSVAVSSRGTVYIAHMLVDDLETGGEGIQIHVHRTGENWPYVTLSLAAAGNEPASSYSHTPIVLVGHEGQSAADEDVYVVWVDFSPNGHRIYTTWSTNGAATFAPEARRSVAAGLLLTIRDDNYVRAGSRNLIQPSLPMARYNTVANSIGIVWHVKESVATEATTDVKFIRFDPVQSSFGPRRTVTAANDATADGTTTGNQWNPALHYDQTGKYIVTFYDSRGQASGIHYRLKGARLEPDGTRVNGLDDLELTTTTSNPKGTTGNCSLPETCTLGEYQDLWYSAATNKWHAAYIEAKTVDDVTTSNPAVVRFTAATTCAPVITVQPRSTSPITAGSSEQLSVQATGTNLVYQWYRGNTGDTSSPIGTNSPSVTVTPAGTTAYWVAVSSGTCTTNSVTAVVGVVPQSTTPMSLHVVLPCRVFDTRGGPALTSNVERVFQVSGNCGIPSTAKAIVGNATAYDPPSLGWLTVYPAGIPRPFTSSLNYRTGRMLANNVIVRLSPSGQLAVYHSADHGGPMHFFLDVTGYFE